MSKCVDELFVYQKALAAAAEISKVIRRLSFARDLRLREQLSAASVSAPSLIAEGFEQSSDRHFAQYCYRSKGSCAEVRTQLMVARDREHITELERAHLAALYDEVAKMLSSLIAYLHRSDRKDRGRRDLRPKARD